MRDPLNRTAQKQVNADEVLVGDLIYRPTETHGDLMMEVRSIDKGVHSGLDVYVLRGVVYKLTGSGAGQQAAFLGDMTATRAGTGTWYLPFDGTVVKGVRPEEADYQMLTTNDDDDR